MEKHSIKKEQYVTQRVNKANDDIAVYVAYVDAY